MRNIAAVLITVLITTLLAFGLGSAPAAADGRRCVSEVEYQDIRWRHPPSTMGRVHDHFDTKGVLWSRWSSGGGREDVIRSYAKCSEWNRGRGRVFVWFDNYSWDSRMRVYGIAPNAQQNWVSPG